MKMGTGRDWAFITAMIAGASIPFPMLAPFALGGMIVLGVRKIGDLLRRKTIAGVVPWPCCWPPRRWRPSISRSSSMRPSRSS
jgi:hypothetical protein